MYLNKNKQKIKQSQLIWLSLDSPASKHYIVKYAILNATDNPHRFYKILKFQVEVDDSTQCKCGCFSLYGSFERPQCHDFFHISHSQVDISRLRRNISQLQIDISQFQLDISQFHLNHKFVFHNLFVSNDVPDKPEVELEKVGSYRLLGKQARLSAAVK